MGSLKEFFEYIFNAVKIWIIVLPWQSGLIVRNGKRKRKLSNGIYFRIPYFDSVYIQEIRLRVIQFPIQTITTKDEKTITINATLGYSIEDIEKLYETLYHPEVTLQNMAMAEISDYAFKNNLSELTPAKISESILDKLKIEKYGLKSEYLQIANFAVVKTFRLIQDQTWFNEGMKLDEKK